MTALNFNPHRSLLRTNRQNQSPACPHQSFVICALASATWTLYEVPPREWQPYTYRPLRQTFLPRAPHTHTPSCEHECAICPAEDGRPRVSGRPRAQAMISPFFGGHHTRALRRPSGPAAGRRFITATVVPWLTCDVLLTRHPDPGTSVELCGTRDDVSCFLGGWSPSGQPPSLSLPRHLAARGRVCSCVCSVRVFVCT